MRGGVQLLIRVHLALYNRSVGFPCAPPPCLRANPDRTVGRASDVVDRWGDWAPELWRNVFGSYCEFPCGDSVGAGVELLLTEKDLMCLSGCGVRPTRVCP